MPKARNYPPSHIRYQIEHPPVTVHLNKRLKEVLDAVRGNRSYGQVVLDILQEKLDIESEVRRAPVTQLLMQYGNGFSEAADRYGIVGKCKKCGRDFWPLWKDGKCDVCHNLHLREPKLTEFRERPFIDPEDYEKVGRNSILDPEKAAYNAGMEKGKEEGLDEGWEKAEEYYKITYPCSRCGQILEMHPEGEDYKAMKKYMMEHGWRHSNCIA